MYVMKEIIQKPFRFVRHGRTDWNDQSLCQGQLDIELNGSGIAEAHLLGKLLSDSTLSTIFTSPLKRAYQTAAIVAEYQKQSRIYIADQLKERSWGNLEGISSDEMYKIEELELLNSEFIAEATIEPKAVFKARIIEGLNHILSLEEENPLIVSHGRVFLVLCEILKVPPVRQVPNTTIMHCIPESSEWIIDH
ncbi:MAG: hypothetical protein K0S74_1842 [Chlamydiales bacterium]|jgi:broad specificity phosphatase PhoE|nr:hypothetical protein [Chlamydiales bacterium]